MYVGVILETFSSYSRNLRIPHVCGGDPGKGQVLPGNIYVFPMYVGVILSYVVCRCITIDIPHVCGGDHLTTVGS